MAQVGVVLELLHQLVAGDAPAPTSLPRYGTPVRAPVDGVAHSATDGLGGLTVKVFMPDGTYFYLAHLSGLVERLRQRAGRAGLG